MEKENKTTKKKIFSFTQFLETCIQYMNMYVY